MKTTIINKILLVLMLITAQQVSALEFQVDGIYYRTSIFTKNSAYVTHSGTSYTESVEYQGEVVIPESVTYNGKTYTIASIGGYAFAGCPGLTSVTIPNTVTTINQNAFNGCTGLKTIECKATTPPALGDNAFTSYDATLVVPSSSESVYKSAAGWSNFKFKEEPSETPGSGENSGEDSGSDNSGSDNTYGLACKILNSTDVAIIAGSEKYTGDIVIPSQVTISGKTYTVTSIANDAFKGCSGLTSITIPSSITSIGSSSFDSCTNLNKVSISDMLSWCKITFGNSLANPLYYAKNLYLNGSLVTKLEIPSAITEIKNYTFYNCTSISTIVFPSGILKIGNSAFVNCSNMTSVTIPNSVTTIDENAFNGCTGLASLTIGSSVGSIGNYAFGNCTGLKSVTSLNSTPPTCGTGVFQGVTISSIPLTVPAGSESLYKATYTWQDFKYKEESENPGDDPAVDTSGLKYNIISSTDVEVIGGTEKYTGDIVIPSQTTIDGKTYNVTKIGIQAFNGCAGLTSITIPSSVVSLGEGAFFDCTGLTSISIPNSVTSIGENVFAYCENLKTVTLSNKIKTISFSAFSGCYSLTGIEIPNSVTTIDEEAFSYCESITNITIGENVNSIGKCAFMSCNGLSRISTLNPTPPTCGENVFKNVNVSNVTLTVPTGSVSIYKSADIWKDFKYEQTEEEPSEPELPTDNSGLSYNILNETDVEVIAGTEKYTGDIVIPSQTTIDGKVYNVTKVGNKAFYKCTGLTSVTIPNSVTSIGERAFAGCSGLKSIIVESGNTVYDSRDNCNAIIETSTNILITGCKNTVIPNSVTGIGDDAFSGCSGLTSVTIPNSVTSIGERAFAGCSGLTSITIPDGVTSIGTLAFYGCSGLTSITIPNSVTNIGSSAFSGCSGLTSIVVESGNTVYDSRNNCNATIETSTNTLITGCKNTVIPNSVTSIGSHAFSGCSGLTSVTIPDGVTSIGDFAFEGCSGLTSVTIPSSVTCIGEYAFFNCNRLTSVISLNPTPPTCGTSVFGNVSVGNITLEVPSESVSMYQSADTWKDFGTIKGIAGSSALTYNILNETDVEVVAGTEKYTGDIVIPSQSTIDGKVYNVTQIGDAAFQDCTNLTSVTIPNSVTSIGNYAFSGCSGLTSVNISDLEAWCKINFAIWNSNPLYYAKKLYLNGELLTGLIIPDSIKEIKNYAFYGCSSLTSVTIGNSVTTIGDSAFEGCTGLTSVNISDLEAWCKINFAIWNSNPLYYAKKLYLNGELLTGLIIPDSIKEIKNYAFYGCSSLTSVTIPNSVTSIGALAFRNCSGLTSITIPNSVTGISNNPFAGCSGLTSIVVESGNSKYDSRDNCNAIIVTPTNVLITGCKNTVIPNTVTYIGSIAFTDCSSLISVTIPNSVTNIGSSAFSGCSGLTSVTIPNSVTSIGEAAFSDCRGLTSIIVESGNTVYDSRDNCNAIIKTSTNTLITGCKNTVIPNSVTIIGPSAFSHCSGLPSVTIPNSVTSIGNEAFAYCSGLTSITIPNSVTSIGYYAFEGCSGLTSIISLNPTPPTCGRSVFYNVSMGNITLEVPAESVSMYQSADTWKDFGTIETYISSPVGLSKMWAIPFDPSTGLCSSRTVNGFGDVIYGANNTAGTIEEWKDGVLVTSYDVNKFCADNNLGETVKVIDSETGTETEKFQSYFLWTAVMVDDAGNLLVNVGTGAGSAATCQNWVLLPALDRNAMQLLHIDEFPSADVTLGRVDVPSRIVGNITDGGAYLYIPASGSALMPVMYIALDGDGKIYYDAENSWILMSSRTFDASTNVATFQTADEILGAADEAAVAAKTYVRWRGQVALFTWNAETSQLEQNTSFVPGVVGTPGMDVFKIGEIEYIVLPVKSATTGNRGSSVAIYCLADGTEVASWDATSAVDYFVGSVQARVNPDGKTANIYVCGHKDCFGILKFYPGSSVKSIANEGLSYGKGSSALDEIVTEENAAVEYYNLQGVRVMNPEKGIYIKRQGGKTSKVVL